MAQKLGEGLRGEPFLKVGYEEGQGWNAVDFHPWNWIMMIVQLRGRDTVQDTNLSEKYFPPGQSLVGFKQTKP